MLQELIVVRCLSSYDYSNYTSVCAILYMPHFRFTEDLFLKRFVFKKACGVSQSSIFGMWRDDVLCKYEVLPSICNSLLH